VRCPPWTLPSSPRLHPKHEPQKHAQPHTGHGQRPAPLQEPQLPVITVQVKLTPGTGRGAAQAETIRIAGLAGRKRAVSKAHLPRGGEEGPARAGPPGRGDGALTLGSRARHYSPAAQDVGSPRGTATAAAAPPRAVWLWHPSGGYSPAAVAFAGWHYSGVIMQPS
jgi:hypothetical protein